MLLIVKMIFLLVFIFLLIPRMIRWDSSDIISGKLEFSDIQTLKCAKDNISIFLCVISAGTILGCSCFVELRSKSQKVGMRESEDQGRAGIGQLLEELCQWLAASTECSFAVLLLLCHE